ncbi:beta-ketoacyl synthase N-terminal-like domain-containing protein, partial [Ligilactobacillus salivarius]|nr:beta-ketoacyl synthase N-terminal-like domain-containing protein [Ligilactobacillus salivarius]
LFDVDVVNESSETVLHYSGYSLKQLRISNQRGNQNKAIKASNLKARIRSYVTDKLAVNMADPSKLSIAKAHIMDFGIDSSQLVALTREMEAETKIELNPTLFFEYPTIQKLIDFFADKHEASFAQLFGEAHQQEERPAQIENQMKQIPAYETNTDKTIEHAADGIAIIGMSGQFPKANSVTEFWDNLIQGKNCVSEVPKERWDWRKYAAADKEGQSSLQWGGFIEGIGEFDPLFFGISPKEA